jgi:TPR repeat protein
VAQDYVQAVFWYRKAAGQGHIVAQTNLGLMYEHGQGVAQDYSQAAAWYRKEQSQGHAARLEHKNAARQ